MVTFLSWLAPLAALLAATAAYFTYRTHRRNLASKLNDRLYDFDKLVLSQAGSFAEFMAHAVRTTDNYFLETTPGDKYYQSKAFAFFYLNMFEEIYSVYGGLFASRQTWRAWQNYIFSRMKHSLVRETFLTSAGVARQNGKLIRVPGGIFDDGFVDFICKHEGEWMGSYDRRSY